jgi:hypothetical protein
MQESLNLRNLVRHVNEFVKVLYSHSATPVFVPAAGGDYWIGSRVNPGMRQFNNSAAYKTFSDGQANS